MKTNLFWHLLIVVISMICFCDQISAYQLVKRCRMGCENPYRTYEVLMMGPSIGDTRDMFAHWQSDPYNNALVVVYLADPNISQYANSIRNACSEWNSQVYSQPISLSLVYSAYDPIYAPIADDGTNSIGLITNAQDPLWVDFGFYLSPTSIMGVTMIEIDDNSCIQEFDLAEVVPFLVEIPLVKVSGF